MKKKCSGDLRRFVISSPIGNLVLEQCQFGLHKIAQTAAPPDLKQPNLKANYEVELVDPASVKAEDKIWQSIKWMQLYFTDPHLIIGRDPPPICEVALDAESFRGNVRKTLMENVKTGNTITYGKLAELVNNKGASRAVGTAMSNNPLSILVPCHRVIKSDGSPGNYGKSTRNEVKQWLLDFEGVVL